MNVWMKHPLWSLWMKKLVSHPASTLFQSECNSTYLRLIASSSPSAFRAFFNNPHISDTPSKIAAVWKPETQMAVIFPTGNQLLVQRVLWGTGGFASHLPKPTAGNARPFSPKPPRVWMLQTRVCTHRMEVPYLNWLVYLHWPCLLPGFPLQTMYFVCPFYSLIIFPKTIRCQLWESGAGWPQSEKGVVGAR